MRNLKSSLSQVLTERQHPIKIYVSQLSSHTINGNNRFLQNFHQKLRCKNNSIPLRIMNFISIICLGAHIAVLCSSNAGIEKAKGQCHFKFNFIKVYLCVKYTQTMRHIEWTRSTHWCIFRSRNAFDGPALVQFSHHNRTYILLNCTIINLHFYCYLFGFFFFSLFVVSYSHSVC